MELVLVKVVAALVKPPAINLLLTVVGLVLLGRRRRTAVVLLALGLGGLYVLSLPVLANAMQRALQTYPALAPDLATASDAQAIVVLGGGLYPRAPEYGDDTVSGASLERIRYGAWLQRRTGLPLLVSGGSVFGGARPEAELMARALEEEFGARVRWRETRSRNTFENARYSAEMLAGEAVNRIALVTHASHMARAVAVFRRQGLEVVPAPTELLTESSDVPGIFYWLPSAGALASANQVFHEAFGILWYRIRY